jgi:hypothetical protein
MRLASFICYSLMLATLTGCSGLHVQNGEATGKTARVTPQPNTLISAADWHPGEVKALGTWERMTSHSKLHGDLIVAQSTLRFVPRGEIKGRNDPGIQVYRFQDIEIAYRQGNWLFIRGYPDESGLRQFQGFYITDGLDVASLALSELRKRLPIGTNFMQQGALPHRQLLLVAGGDPVIQTAVVDRAGIGKKTASGAAGSFVEAIGPNALGPYVLIPPVAAVVIVGGAVAGTVQGEREAQRDASILALSDPILIKAVHDNEPAIRIAEAVRQQFPKDLFCQMIVDGSATSIHGFHYQGAALRQVYGAVEFAPLTIELRTNKTDLENRDEEAEYALSVAQKVTVYSTINGEAVETIEAKVGAGRHTLSELQAEAGKKFVGAIQKAIAEIPNLIVSKLPDALNKLPEIE